MLDIPLPPGSQGKFVNMVNERSPWEYFVNPLDITMTSPFSREICENGK
ncbi:hypothetical protein [Cylindrospermopsis raciborskii]|nr:hypothetical protein [Cylindrospermopsis raciborskii]